MLVDDRALLRDLKEAIQSTDGQGAAAQARAIEEVLRRHGASAADVQRLLGVAKRRRHAEISGLQQRIDGLIESRANQEVDQATADAVDRFLRGLGGSSG